MPSFKRATKLFLAFSLAISISGLGTHSVMAQLDQAKAGLIKSSCLQAQVVVQQIQYNDAATRVNRGQSYETLLADFINPLNSRAAANGFNNNAASLTAIATRYQKNLTKFKNDYEVYDDTISALLKTKCRDRVETFYDYLEKARAQRGVLATDVATLEQIIDEYEAAAVKLQGAL